MGKLVHRVGTEAVPKFGGVRRECDPGAIPPHMFRDLINVRLKDAPGAPVVSRGGQTPYASGIEGCVRGIFAPEYQFEDLQPCGICSEVFESGLDELHGAQLYEVGLANLAQQITTTHTPGAVYNYFSPVQSPVMRTYRAADDFDPLLPNTNLNMVVFTDDGSTAYMAGVDWDASNNATRISIRKFARGAAPVEVATIAAPYTDAFPVSLAYLPATFELFVTVARSNGTGSIIYKSDGAGGLVIDNTPGGNGIPLLRRMGTELYAFFSFHTDGTQSTTFAGRIRRRLAGVWSDLTLPAAVTKFSATSHPMEYSGALYCHGYGAASIFATAVLTLKVVGTVVTLEVEEGTTTSHGKTFQAVLGGNLYYVFIDESDNVFIGKFDGAAWTNEHKDLVTIQRPLGLFPFSGSLRLLTLDTAPPDCKKVLFSSPGSVVSGTWVKEATHHSDFSSGGPPSATMIGAPIMEVLSSI